ncbi:MAG: hypothetical protein KJO54_05925 [Gammaproteobacteria bacterium]|nr:hypothetical protein [Gammaproteobacteria bacterium]NNF60003.1 hypothetical protein [Gammaproteobacteria bacterium]NNM20093.1 hypothetical protein [Gammaproteobacteria bacterium]
MKKQTAISLLTLSGLFLPTAANAQQYFIDMRAALVAEESYFEQIFREPLLEAGIFLPDTGGANQAVAQASLLTGALHARSICPGASCSARTSWADRLTFDATGIDPGATVILTVTGTVEGITGPTVGTGYTLFAQSVANFTVIDTARATGLYFFSEPTTTSNPDAYTPGEQEGTWVVYGPDLFVGQLTLQAGAVNEVYIETIVNGDTTMDIVTSFAVAIDPVLPFTSASGAFMSESEDADADGIIDLVDNCTEVFNPVQRDTDGDDFGNYCDADLNNDNIVDLLDLAELRTVFLTSDPTADLNGDGAVDLVDLSLFRQYFLQPPGPSGLR